MQPRGLSGLETPRRRHKGRMQVRHRLTSALAAPRCGVWFHARYCSRGLPIEFLL
jgi:hypothetical protein